MEADFLVSCDNSSTEIVLRNTDRKALIDTEDFALVSKYTWGNDRGYIIGCVNGNGRVTRLHRFILEAHGHDIKGRPIDHANHDPFDNRKCNLRVCTTTENRANSLKPSTNTSGYKGVTQRKHRWQASIEIKGKYIDLGSYATPEEAARAYDIAAIAEWGEFALINNVDSSIVPKRNFRAKFSNEQVAEIRKLAAEGYSYKELATMFSLSYDYVYQIVNRIIRKNVNS